MEPMLTIRAIRWTRQLRTSGGSLLLSACKLNPISGSGGRRRGGESEPESQLPLFVAVDTDGLPESLCNGNAANKQWTVPRL